ncbi:ubiquinone/menaquinone biosynthesis methyltransferase family protein [Neorickettsia helminthoeca str. Oregon]|uniref:Ubiquinone/menaquinone biosynthesis C-methyltransferase UbiE n=1 Tax=Neorickettsia helminthoeca str. Oregon TaxID=1286528 RepID=X5HMU9_9RICK|nr:class I SAM-dependent methyltransferase [Neorickettsia helminthoeca]AHX11825.1 ubiquinone/menaquinone biosynthesis methyltransferase family protein [Neorickettsia helminthoeca str. Oregon]
MHRDFVDGIFSSVSKRYDLTNDLMSAGIHRRWKRNFVKSIGLIPNQLVLDMAAGTGDITLRLLETDKSPDVIMCDRNPEMLQIAKDRLLDNGYLSVKIVRAEAAELPFEDNTFDHYVVAFGVRNFSDIQKSISEAHRVLRTGGKFSCLEFSNVDNSYINMIYGYYSRNFIPWIGEKVTQNRDAYVYLVESIKNFPDAESFKQILSDTGFTRVKYEKATFGVVAIHTALKV